MSFDDAAPFRQPEPPPQGPPQEAGDATDTCTFCGKDIYMSGDRWWHSDGGFLPCLDEDGEDMGMGMTAAPSTEPS